MRKEMRHDEFFGRDVEVRIEENGHSATDGGGCICSDCRRLRNADGRCEDCGTTEMKFSVGSRCVACAASGLGA